MNSDPRHRDDRTGQTRQGPEWTIELVEILDEDGLGLFEPEANFIGAFPSETADSCANSPIVGDDRMGQTFQGLESTVDPVETLEGESALGLFAPEPIGATVEGRVRVESNVLDAFPSEIADSYEDSPVVRDLRPPFLPLTSPVAGDAVAAPSSTRHWVSAALVSATALALVVFSYDLRTAVVDRPLVPVAPPAPSVTQEPLQRSAHTEASPEPATTTDGPVAASVKPAAREPSDSSPSVPEPSPRITRPLPQQSELHPPQTQLSRTAAGEPAAAAATVVRSGGANPPASSATPPVASSAAPSNASDRETTAPVAAPASVALLPSSPSASPAAPAPPPARTAGPAVTVLPGASPPAAAPPVAAPPRAVQVAVVSDSTAVQAVVGRYLDAFRTFNVEEAKAVWPSVNERALGRAFASVDKQEVELDGCIISVAGPSAGASCSGVVRYVPKVGAKTMRIERRQWKFELLNSNSEWRIENVDVH